MLLLYPATAQPHDLSSWSWASFDQNQQLTGHGSEFIVEPGDTRNSAVLVVPFHRLSWHRVTLPKTPKNKYLAILAGALEEHLLDEPESLHFAFEAGVELHKRGAICWVAVCQLAWLHACLDTVSRAGIQITRIIPEIAPCDTKCVGHEWQGITWLTLCTTESMISIPVNSETVSVVRDTWRTECTGGMATHQAASNLERLFPDYTWVPIHNMALCWAASLRSDWDLAQLGVSLSGGANRTQKYKEWLRSLWTGGRWHSARWALASVVVVQLLGIQLLAWKETSAVATLRQQINDTLRLTFPEIRVVIDAPLQMQREVEKLRTASGTIRPNDLEALLQALGRLELSEPLVLESIQSDSTQVILSHQALSANNQQNMAQQLSSQGWSVVFLSDSTRLEWKSTP